MSLSYLFLNLSDATLPSGLTEDDLLDPCQDKNAASKGNGIPRNLAEAWGKSAPFLRIMPNDGDHEQPCGSRVHHAQRAVLYAFSWFQIITGRAFVER